MAFTNSGLYVQAILDMLKTTALTGNTAGTGPWLMTTGKLALHSNTLTQGTAPINYSSTTPNWANTNEVSGTGWAAGGVLFSALAAGATSATPTLAEGTAGSLRYDHTNDTSVASTTLTNARGCILYADALTAPAALADLMLVAVTFGADFSTVAGTFGIQWSATGIWEIDLTP
jgi:hypothetical protein